MQAAPATPPIDAPPEEFARVEEHARRVAQGERTAMGTGTDLVRYLGSWIRFDGMGRDNINKRLQAAREGHYSMRASWRDRNVSVFFRRIFFSRMCV